jgi:hypothetical protein
VLLLALAFGRKAWLIAAPSLAALVTYAVFRVIDKRSATKVAKAAYQRVLDSIHPEIKSTSPPDSVNESDPRSRPTADHSRTNGSRASPG